MLIAQTPQTSGWDAYGNAADLRGSILRIHPDESTRGYSIPAGNFGERFAAYFRSKGDSDLASAYADPARVRPEIYVKGTQNPYSLFVDPVRRWLAWGDVGPDQGKQSEEYNLTREAAFAGWPYYAGEEDMAGDGIGARFRGSTRALAEARSEFRFRVLPGCTSNPGPGSPRTRSRPLCREWPGFAFPGRSARRGPVPDPGLVGKRQCGATVGVFGALRVGQLTQNAGRDVLTPTQLRIPYKT